MLVPAGRESGCQLGLKKIQAVTLTLLNFLISLTSWLNASSTLMRCLAEVSMNLQLKCFARSRPSIWSEWTKFEARVEYRRGRRER